MQWILIVGLLFAIFVAIFSIQNAVTVSLVFFTWNFKTSLVVVLFGSIILGAIIMWLFSLFKQMKLKRKIKNMNNELIKLERELQEKEEVISVLENKSQDKYLNVGKDETQETEEKARE